MEFIPLENENQLLQIAQSGGTHIIFKHNISCPISRSVRQKLQNEASQLPADTPFYVLDILSKQELSKSVAEKFKVPHESPQLILVKNGSSIYDESLYHISAEAVKQAIEEAENE
jgi:bacillithiol system protein YtxJ